MRDGLLDYTGEAVEDVRSAGIPGIVKLTIHNSTTSTSKSTPRKPPSQPYSTHTRSAS